MNCDWIEERLPQYLEGDMAPDEQRLMKNHVESCARCRRSLEAFAALEASLVGLKAAVPPWKTAEARFVRAAAFGARRSVASLVLGGPFLTGLMFIALGVVTLLKRDAVRAALESFGDRSAVALDGVGRLGARSFDALAGTNPLILISIYGLLLISLLGASRLLVLRFARK